MKLFASLILAYCTLQVQAQNSAGITHIRDTTYNTKAEYRKHVRNYPFIKIVEEHHPGNLIVEKNLLYCGDQVLDVFKPADTKKDNHIAVIFIHGGGWRNGSRDMHYPLAEALALKGYTCITPAYRLSTDALFPAAVEDVKNAIRWVRANAYKLNIDAERIVIAGHSSGGQLAALAGTTGDKNLFNNQPCNKAVSAHVNAIIDIDGILAFIHPESGEGDDSKKTSAATLWFGYNKEQNPALWNSASPLQYADAATPPTLFINSSVERMHAGRTDFLQKLIASKTYNEVRTFENSPHSFLLFHPWFDSTVSVMNSFLTKLFAIPAKREWIVSKSGDGDFTTLQAAINAVPLYNKKTVTIHIRNGVYREKVHIDSLKDHIHLVGEDREKTVIIFNDHTGKPTINGDTINTRSSWTMKVEANDFHAENISFQNDAGFSAGQAVAMECDGDRAVFRNCSFIGNQDVLFTNRNGSRQYFRDCYIEGTTDFIFGSSIAWFENCHIHSKKNSHITAAATPRDQNFGYIFHNSRLTGDSSLHNVSLGRPWRPYAQVSYLECFLGAHIKPEGWSNWNDTEHYKTARYNEYHNTGPGADIARRVMWSKQLSDAERKKITLKTVFGNWNPLQ